MLKKKEKIVYPYTKFLVPPRGEERADRQKERNGSHLSLREDGDGSRSEVRRRVGADFEKLPHYP
jgi:hypothetical protein